MRGARDNDRRRYDGAGIIPAYAGSTFFILTEHLGYGDHPRVCGEHGCAYTLRTLVTGSSPRMRGALLNAGMCVAGMGIIPAYAGSTPPVEQHNLQVRDHPRVCGEHYLLSSYYAFIGGSSPRMRGALGLPLGK